MRRIEGYHHSRFLTFSCYRNLDLLGTPAIRDAFAQSLDRARNRHGFSLHSWVAMPNHVHVLLTPDPDGPGVAAICRSIKQPLAQRAIRRWRELNAPVLDRIASKAGEYRFWQRGGGYDRNIYSREESQEKFEYIHANPVRAGLAERTTDWPWSSARWWDGQRDSGLRMDPLPV